MSDTPRLWGYLAQYENTAQITEAAAQVAEEGFTRWDCCVPFPVHGLDDVMKVKRTILPWLVLCGGLTGGTFGMSFMIWVSVFAYPLNIGGKPLASIPAFIPITFELTVLFSAFTIFFGNWLLNGLPRLHHPAFKSKAFERVTDDKFFIMIEADDPCFDEKKTLALLQQTGASLIEEVED